MLRKHPIAHGVVAALATCLVATWAWGQANAPAPAAQPNAAEKADPRGKTSYMPTAINEDFKSVHDRMAAQKQQVMQRQMSLLEQRYDLADRPSNDAKMSRGKPVQTGVRIKLPEGVSWDQLSQMSAQQIREKKIIDDALKGEINKVLTEFKQRFMAEKPAAAHA